MVSTGDDAVSEYEGWRLPFAGFRTLSSHLVYDDGGKGVVVIYIFFSQSQMSQITGWHKERQTVTVRIFLKKMEIQ